MKQQTKDLILGGAVFSIGMTGIVLIVFIIKIASGV
jgi:hypothetical protein